MEIILTLLICRSGFYRHKKSYQKLSKLFKLSKLPKLIEVVTVVMVMVYKGKIYREINSLNVSIWSDISNIRLAIAS